MPWSELPRLALLSRRPSRWGRLLVWSWLRAHLDERVHRGYHPRRGGRYDSGEDRSPSPKPPGPQAFSRAIRRAPFPTGSDPRLLSQSTRGRRDQNCGSRTTVWPANWVERTMTTSSSATAPCSSPTPLTPGWSTCLREAELSARRTAAPSRRFLSSPWIHRRSVVDGSGIARRSIAAAARFWPTPLDAGGGLTLTSSAMRCWKPWGR